MRYRHGKLKYPQRNKVCLLCLYLLPAALHVDIIAEPTSAILEHEHRRKYVWGYHYVGGSRVPDTTKSQLLCPFYLTESNKCLFSSMQYGTGLCYLQPNKTLIKEYQDLLKQMN